MGRKITVTKRPSYRAGVAWIAENDGSGDDERLDANSVADQVTVLLLADLFGAIPSAVAVDIVRYRATRDAEG
jgi:mannose/fructose-specific phosphotransferase system component IIA